MATPYELRFDMYNTALERLKEQYWAESARIDVARETEGVRSSCLAHTRTGYTRSKANNGIC